MSLYDSFTFQMIFHLYFDIFISFFQSNHISYLKFFFSSFLSFPPLISTQYEMWELKKKLYEMWTHFESRKVIITQLIRSRLLIKKKLITSRKTSQWSFSIIKYLLCTRTTILLSSSWVHKKKIPVNFISTIPYTNKIILKV